MKLKSTYLFLVLLITTIFFSGCTDFTFKSRTQYSDFEPYNKITEEYKSENIHNVTGELKISYLNVGQADSTFIILPNGETILIDAGEHSNSDDIIQYINSSDVTELNYVIATHPHADHIGGMAAVIDAFLVKNIYMPDITHTSKTFENLIDTIDKKGLTINIAKAGKTIFDYGNVKAEFIAPTDNNYSNLNNYSAVVLLTYNNCRFLFMSDAEKESETKILKAGYSVYADVLKVGHHGSDTSSTESFIKNVSPKYAIISCGAGNSYGHPSPDTLALFNKMNINVLRTDTDGTIIVICDGNNISLENLKTQIQPRSPPPEPPITSTESIENTTDTDSIDSKEIVYITQTGKKYHRDGCRYLNQSKIAISLKKARKKYDACSVCKPPQ